MFYNLKKQLYFSRMQLLFNKGLKEGKIVPFDDELYKKMSHIYFDCIPPISMRIKYLNPRMFGKCYDRSLLMFFCFDDALLVRANTKSLELRFGKESAGHGWIEIGNYVYDPSLMMRFDKDLYYEIYSPTEISKTTKADYIKLNGDYYNKIKNTKIEDFQIGGNKRADLCVTIPLIIESSNYNDDFKRELNDYLVFIQYDEKQVYDQFMSEFEECIKRSLKK